MREYLIFHYAIDGVDYVEAYPSPCVLALNHWKWLNLHPWEGVSPVYRDATEYQVGWVSSPSRNQARRAAWSNWLSHIPWARIPYRVYADAPTATKPGTALDQNRGPVVS